MFPMQVPGAAALVPADRINDVEPRNRPLIDRLRSLSVVEHSAAVRDVRAAATTFLEFWEHHDVLVPPTAGIVPPPVRCVDIFFRPEARSGSKSSVVTPRTWAPGHASPITRDASSSLRQLLSPPPATQSAGSLQCSTIHAEPAWVSNDSST